MSLPFLPLSFAFILKLSLLIRSGIREAAGAGCREIALVWGPGGLALVLRLGGGTAWPKSQDALPGGPVSTSPRVSWQAAAEHVPS